jgi:hypothetical protein
LEEEDSSFLALSSPFPTFCTLFPTQLATNPSPERQKQPKPRLSKMQLQLFFYHTNKKRKESKNEEPYAVN